MAHSGVRSKTQRSRSIKDALAQAATKMAAGTSRAESSSTPRCTQRVEEEEESRDSSPSPARDTASHKALLQQFDRMLHKALQTTSKQITELLTKEIRELGHRTDQLESRMDETTATLTTQEKSLEGLMEDNQRLSSKLEDLENRSRRSNLRFRGIPEHVTDLQATVTALIQELTPSLPLERLEMERVHRALVRKQADGPPRDVIAKFLYYRTKEAVMLASRDRPSIPFQGYEVQIFADLAPSTIQKRRDLKPVLAILRKHQIPYRWGFPFRLSFQYQGRWCHGTNLPALQAILRGLHLSDPPCSPDVPHRGAPKRKSRDKSPNSSLPGTSRSSHNNLNMAEDPRARDSPG